MSDVPPNVVPLRDEAQWVSDSFVNLLAGLGVPGRDKFASQTYVHTPLLFNELEIAYRSDWIARKVVQIPAWDMTREWRAWQADPDQIELLEAAEKKLCLQQKLQQALIKSRLYGGAAIIIGVDAGSPEEELIPDLVTLDTLKFLHVVSRQQIRSGPVIRDISSKYFGEPEYYEAANEPASKTFEQQVEPGVGTSEFARRQVRLHPSRVVRLVGMDTADQMLSDIWGDSVLQPVNDAIKMCGLVTGSLATMVSELKVDVIKIPELKSILSTDAGTRKMMARFSAANVAKSVVNTILIDGNEEWQRIQATLAGLPEVVQAYMQIAAGAADIPATRFLGMSPSGLNATGESDIRNYYDRLSAEQSTILTPTINLLDEVLIRSALGDRPPEIWYEWNSLWQLSENEKADIALKKAQTYQIDVNAAQLPTTALANGRANQLIEDGFYPGLEKALEDAALEGDTIEEHNTAAPAPFGEQPVDGNGDPIPPGQSGGPPAGGAPPAGGKPFGGKSPFQPKKPTLKVVVGGDSLVEDYNPHHKGAGAGGGQFTSGSGGGAGSKGERSAKGGEAKKSSERRAVEKTSGAEGKSGRLAKVARTAAEIAAGAAVGLAAGAAVTALAGGGMKKASPTDFLGARSAGKRSAFLSATSAKELARHQLFLSPDKKTGYALDRMGDLQNVFNNGGPNGAGGKAVVHAIKRGATTLDAFDGFLPKYYAKHGFEPTGRMKFNDEYAPPGWDYASYGRPDVVFMAYRGGKRSTIEKRVGGFKPYDRSQGPYFTDFDEAKAASRGLVVDRQPGRGGSRVGGVHPQPRRRGELHQELANAHGGPAQSRIRLRRLSDENPYHKGSGPGGGQFTTGGGAGWGAGAAVKALTKAAEVPHIKVPAKVEAVAKAGVKVASALALAAGVVPMVGSKAQHPNTIASRLITSKRASEAVKNTYAQPSLAAMKLDPKGFKHNIRLFRDGKFYPNFRKGELTGKPDKDAPVIIEHFKQNLKFLHERAEGKGTTKLWYDGARNIVDHRAAKYGIKDASVTGVYAALSPKKDWDQNVHIGDRVLDIHSKMQDHKWDAKMTEKAAEIWRRPDHQLIVKQLTGKRLRDLETVGDKAIWMRTFDEAHSDRHYRVVRPDGSLGDFATKANGGRAMATWQSVPSISNAVRSLEANGDRSIISGSMGGAHKVRSFYNNIIDPHSPNGDVTVDTHAVGGSLLRPVGTDSAPVWHAFGLSPMLDKKPKGFVGTSNSAITGSSGTYGLYATAHHEVAKELGLQPRQVQSITWVKKRDLFNSSMTDKQKAGVAQAWHEYHTDFGVSLEKTQRKIMQVMGDD